MSKPTNETQSLDFGSCAQLLLAEGMEIRCQQCAKEAGLGAPRRALV